MTANSPPIPPAPCKLPLKSNPPEIGFLGELSFGLGGSFVKLGNEFPAIVEEVSSHALEVDWVVLEFV